MRIRVNRKLSYYTFTDRCRGRQGYWWIKGPNGFVDMDTIPGTQVLDVELDLPPGRYLVGVGPDEPRGVRVTVTIDARSRRVLYGH